MAACHCATFFAVLWSNTPLGASPKASWSIPTSVPVSPSPMSRMGSQSVTVTSSSTSGASRLPKPLEGYCPRDAACEDERGATEVRRRHDARREEETETARMREEGRERENK